MTATGGRVKGGGEPAAWGRRTPLAAVLAANSVSAAGTALSMIGIPWFVLQTTGSAGRAGVVAFCATLPIIVSAVIGGPVIDRIGRRRVSIASDLVCAAAVGAIPLLDHAGVLEFWMLCALVAVNGLVHTPGKTARFVLLPDLTSHAGTTLPRAASLFDAVERGARMAGAALAGLLIALADATGALLADAATFGLSALLIAAGLRGIRAAEPVEDTAPVSLRTYGTELRAGYAFLLRTRLLLAVVLMVMVTNGIDQGWSAVLLPVHAERDLGGATVLGLLTAVSGAGGLLGALLYGVIGHRYSRHAVFAVCMLLCGAPRFATAGLSDSTAALAVVMAGAGLASGALNPILTTVIYERVPLDLRSRVSGALTAGCELTMPLGGLTAGLLVEGAGVRTALLLMGGAYLLATLSPFVFPVWRGLNDVGSPGGTDRVSDSAPGGPVDSPLSGPLSSPEPARRAPAT
ncbi:MFS transporter [Streptomyces sp. NPDC051569]|uniref:MFS transporter n=1 Tax=Streptomyces sp. NPDC051569 TaxID=3365661 RepID=UPI00378A4440